ncbi:uncharacterized protein Dwil_GK25560 [Drosophila willistoni]|uniref:Uncharacterized protein n=1 Tax=Drosophila willistoni TaxID=7260 RepID=B4NE23_DROWI|nr:keratin, type I cytoskeletal 9 [Drosophila willistoni]EDW81992.2 uncharacterized protein Dwil_GK25560 [Drosophila willistoni]
MESKTKSIGQLLLLLVLISPPASPRPQLQSHYLRAVTAYRRLERTLPAEELHALTGIGVLNGARLAEQAMEEQLVAAIKKLLLQTDLQQSHRVASQINLIEQQLARDGKALDILGMAIDVLRKAKDEQEFRQELREVRYQHMEEELLKQEESANYVVETELGQRLGHLRTAILKQVPQMKVQLEDKIEKALKHIMEQATADGILAKASEKVKVKRAITPDQPDEMRMIKSILTEYNLQFVFSISKDDFRENLIEQRSDGANQKASPNNTKTELEEDEFDSLEKDLKLPNITAKNRPKIQTHAKQEEDGEKGAGGDSNELGDEDDADEGGGGGGGLVGLIGSLSGGEGGSDVGALIGALTGLISTLFGPGGLDIDALIGTSTSLLAGLLAGNKNFGTVLGSYVGTAFDGLSGGGGAINNGQFLGNFVGTVLASLSADPEEEGPPQPLTFTKNFVTSFLESKFRPVEGSEERHGSAELPRQKAKKDGGAAGGFDSGGFVKQVASHLVSNALSLLLNALLGSSGGAFHASAGIFSSSSSAHHGKPGAGAVH